MSIQCNNCGYQNVEGARFCINCGKSLQSIPETNSHQTDLEWFVEGVYNGEFSLPTENCPIILKKTETPVLVIPNVILKEPRSVRTSVGGYGGPTIRIAKGISFRLGGGSSRSISHEEIKTIDQGTLTITNKRLAFTGTMKTLSYNLNKIISITEYEEGIAIQRENKQKTEYFLGTNQFTLRYKRNDEYNITPINGLILKAAIMGQLE